MWLYRDIKGDLSIKGLGDSRSSRQYRCTGWVWVRDCQGQALRIDEEDGRNDKGPAAGITEYRAMYIRYDNLRIVALAFL